MIYEYLYDTSKYVLAGLIVFAIVFLVLKPRFDLMNKIQLLELKRSLNAQSFPLKLQAYERLVLFIERMNPEHLLLRLGSPGLSARDLHALAINDIKSEYHHNVTQQVYVSTRAWNTLKQVKNDTVSLLNNALNDLPDDASGLDLSRLILIHLSKIENSPYEISVGLIKKDLEEIF